MLGAARKISGKRHEDLEHKPAHARPEWYLSGPHAARFRAARDVDGECPACHCRPCFSTQRWSPEAKSSARTVPSSPRCTSWSNRSTSRSSMSTALLADKNLTISSSSSWSSEPFWSASKDEKISMKHSSSQPCRVVANLSFKVSALALRSASAMTSASRPNATAYNGTPMEMYMAQNNSAGSSQALNPWKPMLEVALTAKIMESTQFQPS
mmetsp:Transcript_129169/g.414069  ORF Transcript_129169/g.414069 Transcript_129169/m.414069 type:complete len:211 (-) Transcript_129169:1176-1808(-)